VAADDFCYLATTGRVTGRPHEIEIWYARDGDTLYLLSGGGRSSDWVRNIDATPAVTLRVGTSIHRGRGRIVTDPEEDARARDLVHDKYQPRYSGSLDDWRVRALPVAIDLDR
jgi:deazaflavin-dependent oxidoreductase (nitroreductase family)